MECPPPSLAVLWFVNVREAKTQIEKKIYTAPQHALTRKILFFKKIIDKANSKFELNIKEAMHINWRKPNLNARENLLAFTLALPLARITPFFLSVFLFCLSLWSIVFITPDTSTCRYLSCRYLSCRYLLLS